MRDEEDVAIKFVKIELDSNNYVYNIYKNGYPCGIIKYSELEKSFVFIAKTPIEFNANDLELITSFVKNYQKYGHVE